LSHWQAVARCYPGDNLVRPVHRELQQDFWGGNSMAQTLSLREVNPGQRATIVRVDGASAVRRRLIEMGIVPGETIQAERVAPLGDPVVYRIKGYRLSLRGDDAAKILVTLEAPNHHG
jgi:ferrous iron transport protein A